MRRIYEPMAYGQKPASGNYWRGTVQQTPRWPRVREDLSCDFAIVGGGYTGLNAALDLAEAGADVILIDANAPGWGASGRNGGFCCLGGEKLSSAGMVRKFGEAATRQYSLAKRSAVDLVADRLDRYGIDAQTHSNGETVLAHRPADVAQLKDISRQMHALYRVESDVLCRDDLAAAGLSSAEFHGGVTIPIGFALNPLRYVVGLAQAAQAAGCRIFRQSPATSISNDGGAWQIQTPNGRITAARLLMATNGYSAEDVPGWMAGRFLPVQSNILVTRELSQAELDAQGWTSTQMCYDTRRLLHYFRLMPNRRILFGLRGAHRATPEAFNAIRATARADFDRIFPAWKHVETPHFWSGIVAMARNLTPFVGPMQGVENAYAAMCYHGNGVAMGSYAGSLLADVALGRTPRHTYPELMRQPMGRFPLGRFRRALLPLAYTWYRFQDGD